jgi:hypothetical protein
MTESRAIRDRFGLFWRKRSGKQLPNELKGITIANVTTFHTRDRVRDLKEICRKHSAANPGLNCFVTNYVSHPELKIKNRREPMVSLSYTEAVTQLPQHLSPEFLTELCQYARTGVPESELADRFLILNPDLIHPGDSHEPDASLVSMDESQPQAISSPSAPTVAADQPSASSQPAATPATPSDTSSGFTLVSKKNRSRFFNKPAPYSKKN